MQRIAYLIIHYNMEENIEPQENKMCLCVQISIVVIIIIQFARMRIKISRIYIKNFLKKIGPKQNNIFT